VRAALIVEAVAVVVEQDLAEAVEGAQRRAQVVRDRVGERLQLFVGGVELGGACPDALLQLQVEQRESALRFPARLFGGNAFA